MISSLKEFKAKSNPNATFDTLENYTKIARRQIIYFCNRYHPGYRNLLLNSDDSVSIVAYANMLADWRYDETMNKATKATFRNNYALGYIRNIINSVRKSRGREFLDGDTLIKNIEDKESGNPQVKLLHKEELNILESHIDSLPARSADIVKRFYLEEESAISIAKSIGVTRTRFYQLLENATLKLRGCYKCKIK